MRLEEEQRKRRGNEESAVPFIEFCSPTSSEEEQRAKFSSSAGISRDTSSIRAQWVQSSFCMRTTKSNASRRSVVVRSAERRLT